MLLQIGLGYCGFLGLDYISWAEWSHFSTVVVSNKVPIYFSCSEEGYRLLSMKLHTSHEGSVLNEFNGFLPCADGTAKTSVILQYGQVATHTPSCWKVTGYARGDWTVCHSMHTIRMIMEVQFCTIWIIIIIIAQHAAAHGGPLGDKCIVTNRMHCVNVRTICLNYWKQAADIWCEILMYSASIIMLGNSDGK